MTVPCVNACSVWGTEADACSPCDGDYALDTALYEDMLAIASDVLFERSGRRFPGSCEDRVRPCRQCSCRRVCTCGNLSQIEFGLSSPITGIVEVKVDGAVLDPSTYRVDDHRYLVRLADADGSNPGWPSSQRMDLASTEDETFEVTFTYGSEPPPAGVKAAAALACELYQACQPEDFGDCNLPPNVRSVARQGVSMDFDQIRDLLDTDTLSAIPAVRIFLDTYGKGPKRPPGVMSPDVPSLMRRVGT